MKQVCREVTDYIRSCEHLLCKQEPLTDDERGLLEYYVKELSQSFLAEKASMVLQNPQQALTTHGNGQAIPRT